MSLSRIVMRLARNPGSEVGGDDRLGYTLTAPLTAEGRLDAEAYAQDREACSVRRFAPDEDAVTGRLARRGQNWFFDYDRQSSDDDEPVHRLGDHRFVVGEYVTVTDEGGQPLTYRITEVQAA